MKITVVTINYNNLEGLRETVESVMGQSFPDLEYIVIDGGSTDGSREYLKACHQKTFSYWCSEPDNGLYDAMNKGLKHSTGDYVIFMNSGDRFFSKETLNNVSERIVGNEDVVYGSALFRYSDGYVLRPPNHWNASDKSYHSAISRFSSKEILSGITLLICDSDCLETTICSSIFGMTASVLKKSIQLFRYMMHRDCLPTQPIGGRCMQRGAIYMERSLHASVILSCVRLKTSKSLYDCFYLNKYVIVYEGEEKKNCQSSRYNILSPATIEYFRTQ